MMQGYQDTTYSSVLKANMGLLKESSLFLSLINSSIQVIDLDSLTVFSPLYQRHVILSPDDITSCITFLKNNSFYEIVGAVTSDDGAIIAYMPIYL